MRLTTCGNNCDACQAYMGNYKVHDERKAASAAWQKYLGLSIPADQIHCPGGSCCSEGLGVIHEDCDYKKCALLHNIAHCGDCPEYPCLGFDDGRSVDELSMKKKLKSDFALEEYEKYVKVFDNKAWINMYRAAKGDTFQNRALN